MKGLCSSSVVAFTRIFVLLRHLVNLMQTVEVLHLGQFEKEKEALSFYCNDFKSHLKEHFHSISKAHKHDFFLVVYFTQGSGVHEIDFKSYVIEPGSVFMMSPGQVHHWEVSDDIDGLIFLHEQSFYDKNFPERSIYDFPVFQSSTQSSKLFLSSSEQNQLGWLFTNLKEVYQSEEKLFALEKIVALTDLIYLNLSGWYLNQDHNYIGEAGSYLSKLRKLRGLIDQFYVEHKSAGFYADKMNTSSKHLNRIVQSTIGHTTTDLIIERVILEAKRKLAYEKGTLTDLAYSLGYNDYAYFSKLFKKQVGVSPKEFKGRL